MYKSYYYSYELSTRSVDRVIGLEYEHKHPNRTVIVVRENMGGREHWHLEKMRKGEGRVALDSYNPRSAMHFPCYDDLLCMPKDTTLNYCDINQNDTHKCIMPTTRHCNLSLHHSFGTSNELQPSDMAAMNKLYATIKARPNSSRLSDNVPFLGPATVQSTIRPAAKFPPKIHVKSDWVWIMLGDPLTCFHDLSINHVQRVRLTAVSWRFGRIKRASPTGNGTAQLSLYDSSMFVPLTTRHRPLMRRYPGDVLG